MATGTGLIATVESNGSENSSQQYFDILLVGRTGMGKSTTGNKLLRVDPTTGLAPVSTVGKNVFGAIKQWGIAQLNRFVVGDGVNSVTKECVVLSNEMSNVRILDLPGFADTNTTKHYGVLKGNLQLFRWILWAQQEHNLRFSRVLYFLPQRGSPERAEGTFQEEIMVMHRFFQQKIFDIMIIIATNKKAKKHQECGFDEEDIEQTKKVFMETYEKVTEQRLPSCPPIVYLPFNETILEIESDIMSAKVISNQKMEAPVSERGEECQTNTGKELQLTDISTQNAVKVVQECQTNTGKELQLADISTQNAIKMIQERQTNTAKELQFEDRCARCAVKLVQKKLPTGENKTIKVILENGEEKENHLSFCHPIFIPKYSKITKILGGVVHLATLGSAALLGKVNQNLAVPWFTNSEEVCPNCGGSPHTDGCLPVGQLFTKEGFYGSVTIDHSTKLDPLCYSTK